MCNGRGPQQCRTVFESSCSTKYRDQGDGSFVGDTKCEKKPVEICGAGCVTVPGEEECHEKMVDTLVDVPEETCDLNPQKSCRLVTRLVPSLRPKLECTVVPQDNCNLKFTSPKQTSKPLRTEWCLDQRQEEEVKQGKCKILQVLTEELHEGLDEELKGFLKNIYSRIFTNIYYWGINLYSFSLINPAPNSNLGPINNQEKVSGSVSTKRK